MDLELVALGPDDVDAIHDLVREWERHWEVPMATPRSEILDDFESPHFTPGLDTRGVWREGRLVAYGSVHHTPSGERLEMAYLSGRVHPDWRGLGIGRRLLAWQIERAAERLRQCDPELPWFVRTYEWEWIEEAQRLYARYGLKPARWFEDMVRPLSDPLAASAPEDVEIVPWEQASSTDIHQASTESFRDHWGSAPRDFESWGHLLMSTGMRTDLSFVAKAGDEVVGVCLNSHFPEDQAVTGRLDGWIAHLGVIRPWRKRGVASALIARSLEAFREAGFTHAMIGVDADSPTGASGLYRRLGFTPTHRVITCECRIVPAER